jgi:hypothetical protein
MLLPRSLLNYGGIHQQLLLIPERCLTSANAVGAGSFKMR